MAEIATETVGAAALWVLAKVKNSVCALNSANVESILQLEEEVTVMPESDDIHLGIIHYRNGVLPVLDLRGAMGMVSLMAEEEAFAQMLDQRKRDHVNWVDELKRCMREGETFTLATDPHKCAFGKWYDSYEPESYAVDFQLKKINDPHRKLHESATQVFALEKIADAQAREEEQTHILHNVTENCMHEVLACLEDTKRVFAENSRKMIIVLSDGKRAGGVLVDEVLAVEEISAIARNNSLGTMEERPLVRHVAQRKSGQDLVLVLNTDSLLSAQLKVK